MPKRNKDFYAVAVGHKVGTFSTWDECQKQVSGYPGCKFKGFKFGQEKEAQEYLASNKTDIIGHSDISFAPLEPKNIERPPK